MLDELIMFLEARETAGDEPEVGFSAPHSYRGFYDELAFEVNDRACTTEMLNDATRSLGRVFDGYKGGEFRMKGFTDCWIAEYGNHGAKMSEPLLRAMYGMPMWPEESDN